jgi:ubiquinone/menaquinone biosynthesis C-methylase UbiE
MEYVLTDRKAIARTASYYDKIWRLYELTHRLNGYGRSLDRYLARNPLPLSRGARILDAGCGTGLLTLSLVRSLRFPVRLTALDLSASSVTAARKAVLETDGWQRDVTYTQANMLWLPFADNSFDLVVTSGALEYLPLEDGLNEIARVIAPEGHLLLLPVRPSPISMFLEICFRFRVHPPREIQLKTANRFEVIYHRRFPPFQTIAWTKTAMLARKV